MLLESPRIYPDPDEFRHELTLSDVVRAAAARWKLMLALVVVVTMVALAWSWHAARYRGEGVLQMPDLSLSDYKRYTISLVDGGAFIAFLQSRKEFSPSEVAYVGSRLPTGDGIAPWVRPAFGFMKGDVKDLPDIAKLENQFVGADIQVEARSADIARKLAQAVGAYVADAMVRGRVVDFIDMNLAKTRKALGKIENDELEQKFLMAQQQQRLTDLRDINRRYPEASRENPRQVVTIDKGAARYLSPVTQLVGVESYIADIGETLRMLAHDRERAEADIAFLSLAHTETEKASKGPDKLQRLERALAESFRGADMTKDAVRESFNAARFSVAQIHALADDQLRFVSPPVVRDPSYRQILAITAASALGAVLLAFLVSVVIAWSATLRTPKAAA